LSHAKERPDYHRRRDCGQAVSRQGGIIDDWIIDETDRVVNVENAPSTAALNVGRLVLERLVPRFT
jgi:L-2-hydroxyglutarate oxidase